ncbi:hypothetical protein D3C84_869680 [compost metagenome]
MGQHLHALGRGAGGLRSVCIGVVDGRSRLLQHLAQRGAGIAQEHWSGVVGCHGPTVAVALYQPAATYAAKL